ncbi:NACHT, LRR and PYD domains-containing protein 3-like [Engraulis encrasicolus]|uniref:NACHT, LRR and PYD domains-containing protein 3-like n=1 Tax=Engraulis encrasicolus TaxID=184585 RepID=UPI002FCF4868
MSSPGNQESQLGQELAAHSHSGIEKRPGSPTGSCVSMRSDKSKDEPLRFKGAEPPPDQSGKEKRPGSPTGSCVSMRSDKSMDEPLRFKGAGHPPGLSAIEKRSGSPTGSCVSMRSDKSKDEPLRFKRAEPASDQSGIEKRPGSPTGSCVSMRSDKSKDEPLRFKGAEPPPDQSGKEKRPGSPTGSCVSMRSDKSMDEPLRFKGAGHPPGLSAIEKRSGSPTGSCVSMRSDKSKDEPLRFKRAEPASDQSGIEKRPGSPTGSCVSMRSDKSKDEPLRFKGAEPPPDQSGIEKRPGSPTESCVSMRSDQSKDEPLRFKGAGPASDQSPLQLNKPDCPVPSCVSMKSDQSMVQPLRFGARHSSDQNLILFSEEEGEVDGSREEEEERGELDGSSAEQRCERICVQNHKNVLKEKSQCLTEGISKQVNPTLLNEIYTEVYITEGGCGEVNDEHEVRQIEAASKRSATHDKPIKCNDIFKPLPGQEKDIRTVVTKGVAGIGKTVSVQKFILDWAEGKANQDIHFIFPLPFRELNLVKEEYLSLVGLIKRFFGDTHDFSMFTEDKCKVLFIFDGLDECRIPLNFHSNPECCDVTKATTVSALLTNLIQGNLLPYALLWITSRPAAANQIPPMDQVTEVRGFNDLQKEEYFRKRVSDEDLASRSITHLKSSRSLFIMCHIPVFCWIAATVLEIMLGERNTGEIPKTLTQMYTHYLIIQTEVKQKYTNRKETDEGMIFKLGKLAFQQLQKGNLIFYVEDLRECGIDICEASVYSGVCTQIFREEAGLYQGKVFCFVHLSIQEHLAALYVHLTSIIRKKNVLKKLLSMTGQFSRSPSVTVSFYELHKMAVDLALKSKNGHLDLFLRFLLGLSLESNQNLLRDLLPQVTAQSQSTEKTVHYIKKKIRKNPTSEKCMNLFHCLSELNDQSLMEEIQNYLKTSGGLEGAKLSPAQWSAVVFVLLTSDQQLDEFDLNKYGGSEECMLWLMPVVKASRSAQNKLTLLLGLPR